MFHQLAKTKLGTFSRGTCAGKLRHASGACNPWRGGGDLDSVDSAEVTGKSLLDASRIDS
jgi:hypothetical protein